MAKISSRIKNYLGKNKYKYDVIEHRKTYTAWDTAQTEKVKPQEVGKTLILKADKDIVAALLPANRNLDKQKFLKILNAERKKSGLKPAKKIKWAAEAWMKKNIPGKVGAIAPFRGIISASRRIDIFIDNLLAKNKKIYLGSGEYNASIRVNTSQYIKIEKLVKGSFSIKKN